MVTIRSQILENASGAEAITLENSYVRVTIAKTQGRPLTSVFDKRSGTELLPEGGAVALGDHDDEGGWHVQYREPAGEQDGGAVSLFRLSRESGLDTWAVVSLTPDSPWIQIDVQFHSRQLNAAYLPNLATLPDDLTIIDVEGGTVVMAKDGPHGALVRCSSPQSYAGNGWSMCEVDPPVLLGGRTISGHMALSPYGNLGAIHGVGAEWVAAWHADDLEFVAQADLGEVELHVETVAGETLKAPVKLAVGMSTIVSTAGLPPVKRAALVDQGSTLGWVSPEPLTATGSDDLLASESADSWVDGSPTIAERAFGRRVAAWAACLDSPPDLPKGLPGVEHVVATIDAVRSARSASWAAADEAIDRALVTNGDDTLLWWAKAAVARQRGEDDDALPNAHYLSPMEPMLRVEAFLRQDQAQGSEPNPLLSLVAQDSRSARDCLARLAVWGFWTDFARLADELLRHRDDAVVHYLLAWSLATRTRMQATAAEHVAKAAELPVEDYAWMPPLVSTAVRALAKVFPNDAGLQAWEAAAFDLSEIEQLDH